MVAASPASVRAGISREWIAPVKKASACQAVSYLPGRWESGSRLQTPKTNLAQELIVGGTPASVEVTPDPRSQPQRHEVVVKILQRAQKNPPSPSPADLASGSAATNLASVYAIPQRKKICLHLHPIRRVKRRAHGLQSGQAPRETERTPCPTLQDARPQ